MRSSWPALRGQLTRRLLRSLNRSAWGRHLYSLARGLWFLDITSAASAMAFDLFLATIPMLALFGWVSAQLLHAEYATVYTISLLIRWTPAAVRSTFDQHIGGFDATVAPLSLLGAIWLASSAFHTFFTVMEHAMDGEPRPWWRKRLIAIGCVLAANVAVAVAGVLVIWLQGGPEFLMGLVLKGRWSELLGARRVAILLGMLFATAGLATLYRVGVVRHGVRRHVWEGAFVALVLTTLISIGFSYYVATLARFTLFYGGLAAVAIFLGWLWLCCLALLVGAEVNAQREVTERRTLPHAPASVFPPPPDEDEPAPRG